MEFEPAQYKVGRFYTDITNPKHDFVRGLYYLEQAAQKNQYAQLALGDVVMSKVKAAKEI